MKYLVVLFMVLYSHTDDMIVNFHRSFNLKKVHELPKENMQHWGTCWAFATICSVESSILKNTKTNIDLSEYYLDKFNGFNKFSNYDSLGNGVDIHFGGDYKISAAFNANFGGFPISNHLEDFSTFSQATFEKIKRNSDKKFFVQDIEFLSLFKKQKKLQHLIKSYILQFGAVASIQLMKNNPYAYVNGYELHYYYPKKKHISPPNHAINIIGWDDHVSFNNHKGMWIIRDSAHTDSENKPISYFYTPYDDYYTGRNGWFGAVSFRNIKKIQFNNIYFHSLHGWQYTTTNLAIKRVANKFTMRAAEQIVGIGIYSTKEEYDYKLEIYNNKNESIYSSNGTLKFPGFHYIKLKKNISVHKGEQIFVVLESSTHEYAYDASFRMSVLLANMKKYVDVYSKAQAHQSYYYIDNQWKDFYKYKDSQNGQLKNKHARENNTANIALNVYTKIGQ